ncbi:S8 family peptidase [Ramlibacter sp. PS4R-6]|uniref:S8 family peptidase n=1 Tax=Ramlibacter sp. PS4R-6 TaxID=3133438 RepID=UPI0030AC29B7
MTRFLAFLALALAGSAFAQNARVHESRPIPGRFIVVYKDSVADPVGETDRKVRRTGGRKHHAFSKALKGFSATLSDDAVRQLREDPDVDFVEQDQTVSTTAVENQATWGLDRIDQADRPLDTQYHYDRTGAGVYAFIIDTGIRATHADFGGRVATGFSNVPDGLGTGDCNGHGTHVAGTVGSTTYGVAKGVTLVPVRVLDCDGAGSWSDVIAGIDWVAQQTGKRPAVANMSLGGGFSSAVNAAVARAVAAGVTLVVAAGNENKDACQTSPAGEPTAITVGATTSSDTRASFSNFGTCVDIFAPGVSIKSTWNLHDASTNTISGTSMASPHVTGVAALALEANPSASPAAITDFIVDNATRNRITSLTSNSPNRLLYSLAGGVASEPPPPTVAVKSLAGQKANASGGWAAKVTITVRNVDTGALVSNARVSGSFDPGGTGQCTTTSKGNCAITSATLAKSVNTSVFTVTDVAAPGATYDPSQDAASRITVHQRR